MWTRRGIYRGRRYLRRRERDDFMSMRKLNLNLPEVQKIEINGDVFEIRKSDVDILNKGADLQLKYMNLKQGDLQAIKNAVNETVALIDEILGEGATVKISGGKPVNAALAVEWLAAICGEAGRINDEYIEELYE
jgi:hypothetical protein